MANRADQRNTMRDLLTIALLAGSLIPLSACVTHNFVPGPGMSADDMPADKARCRMFSRGANPGHEFGAYGSPKFVAAAVATDAVVAGVGDAIRTNENYNDCMEARGWRIADTASPAPALAPTSAATIIQPPDQLRPLTTAPNRPAARHWLGAESIANDSDIGRVTYRAVDRLLTAATEIEPGISVAVGLIVSVQRPTKVSQFGRMVADLARGRLAQQGISVIEPQLRYATLLENGRGEIKLSRYPATEVWLPSAVDVVTGSYAVGGNEIHVSLKLVSTIEGRIISAVDFVVPRYPDANTMLSPKEMVRR